MDLRVLAFGSVELFNVRPDDLRVVQPEALQAVANSFTEVVPVRSDRAPDAVFWVSLPHEPLWPAHDKDEPDLERTFQRRRRHVPSGEGSDCLVIPVGPFVLEEQRPASPDHQSLAAGLDRDGFQWERELNHR